MREILFRGQTRRYGEKIMNVRGDKMPSNWVYGGIFPQNRGGDFAIIYQQEPEVHKFSVYADTVGQYTGLTDKNGKKIFEDDIVKDVESGYLYVIKWFPTYACFALANKSGHMEIDAGELEIFINDLLVVGNIYDNPELLEASE
ncbi:MAG: YopX family protein [Acutalibacteraceae bacterium]